MECGKINILIVFGGNGVESDISITSTIQTIYAIDLKKYDYTLVYYCHNHFFIVKRFNYNNPYDFKYNLRSLKLNDIKKEYNNVYIKNKKIDLVIPIFHGKDLEDSTVASFFKVLGFKVALTPKPFSAIFQNKYLTKRLLKNTCNVIEDVLIDEYRYRMNANKYLTEINRKIKSENIIIKTNNLGSSVGVYKVTRNEINKKILEAFKYDNEVLVERCLDNYIELTIAVIRYKTSTLSSIEVIDNKEYYRYDSKYKKSKILFLRDKTLCNRINNQTIKIIEKLNLKGLVRIDYFYDKTNDKIYLNEINATPGALSYYLFENSNMMFSDLIDIIVKEGLHIENILNKKVNKCIEYNLDITNIANKK